MQVNFPGFLYGGSASGGATGDFITRKELEAAGNGQAFLFDGVFLSHIPRGIAPHYITTPSGFLGAPRHLMAPPDRLGPRFEPDEEPQVLRGDVTGDQVMTMQPYRRYIIERIDFLDATGVANQLTFGLFSREGGAAGGGIPILPPGTKLDGLTGALRSRKSFTGLDIDLEAPHLYLNVTTANVAPISFHMLVSGRVLFGSDE